MTSLRTQDSKSARSIAARVSLAAVLATIWCASAPEAIGGGRSPHVGHLPAALTTADTGAAPCSGQLQLASRRPHEPWPQARLWVVADCATEANRIPKNLSATAQYNAIQEIWAVSMHWDPPATTSGLVQYRVERSVNQGPFIELSTSPATPTPGYIDMNVPGNPVTSYLYRVRSDYDGSPTLLSAPSNIDVATTILFVTDGTLAGALVQDTDFIELRSAIEAVCRTAGQTPPSWSEPLIPQQTVIKKAHLEEVRAKASECLAAVGIVTPPYSTDQTITAGVTTIKKEHVQELRDAVH